MTISIASRQSVKNSEASKGRVRQTVSRAPGPNWGPHDHTRSDGTEQRTERALATTYPWFTHSVHLSFAMSYSILPDILPAWGKSNQRSFIYLFSVFEIFFAPSTLLKGAGREEYLKSRM